MIRTLYRGSVKDLLGPLKTQNGSNALVFEYTDAFSVFDWGRMPDTLPRKGEALAVLAADFFEKLETPSFWKEYSKSLEALALRKASRFGSVFNELGEELQSQGLRTHYLGSLGSSKIAEISPKHSSQFTEPFRRMVVQQVSVVKPSWVTILGRNLPDYYLTRQSPAPRLVPLEIVFRFRCTESSSILERTQADPGYLASLGYPDFNAFAGVQWDFPVVEIFTKLEARDRPVALSEALAISGLSAAQLQEILLKSAWVAGILKFWFARAGLGLADGKLEWALSPEGRCFLVDAIGPDEMRLMKKNLQVSKEFLRAYYRTTPWYQAVERAKAQAHTHGIAEWKKFVQEAPPMLSPYCRELATQVYLVLANELTGKKWFSDAWTLDRLAKELVLADDLSHEGDACPLT